MFAQGGVPLSGSDKGTFLLLPSCGGGGHHAPMQDELRVLVVDERGAGRHTALERRQGLRPARLAKALPDED